MTTYKKTHRYFIYGLILFSGFTKAYMCSGQEYLFETQEIDIEAGLPKRLVYNIVQDTEGFIWMSMKGVISRYDGQEFLNFEEADLGVSNNQVLHIGIDKEDLIWFCEGIAENEAPKNGILDYKKDTVYSIAEFSGGLLDDAHIAFIQTSREHPYEVLIFTKLGDVYAYDGKFKKITSGHQWDYRTDRNDILQLSEGNFWLAVDNTLSLIIDEEEIQTFDFPTSILNLFSFDQRLLINFRYDQTHAHSSILEWNGHSISKFSFQTKHNLKYLYELNNAYLVYCNHNALFVQNKTGKEIFRFEGYDGSSSEDRFRHTAFLKDKQNNFWIGTNRGVLKLSVRPNPFVHIQKGNSIRGIRREDSLLFVGGYSGNYILNLNTRSDTLFDKGATTVTGFAKDEKGVIWMGTTFRRIFDYDTNTHDLNTKEYLDYSRLFPFYNASTNNLLFGTRRGIYTFDRQKKEFSKFLLNSPTRELVVRQFYENEDGVWVVSNQGLLLIEKHTERIIKHYSKKSGFPYENLNHIFEDEDGMFWLGTPGQGLIRWDIKKNTFRQFLKKDGLSSENIYSVYPDEGDNLWLSSEYGLMQFNKKDYEVNVFFANNGIANNEFNTYAHHQDEDGKLYLGGINGITIFNPNDYVNHDDTLAVLLTKCLVLEKTSDEFQEKIIDYASNKPLEFHHSDQAWKLHLAYLDYYNSENNQYAYAIDDPNGPWIYSNNHIITLNPLKSGKYTLYLKAKGAYGSESKILSIPIHVLPPFYMKWWFIIGVILFISTIVWAYFKYQTIQLRKRNIHLEQVVTKRTQKIQEDKKTIEEQAAKLRELDKAKTRFFSNITHEFRTPLTLIIGPLEQFLSNQPPPTIFKRRVNGILKNARHLLDLINQMLDLSKVEGGRMKIEVIQGDIVDHTRELVQLFKPLAQKKEQRLNFICKLDTWVTHFDQDKWDKIIYNLLSNAIKFTPSGGLIQLCIMKAKKGDKELIRLDVRDSGQGIEKEQLGQIFNRFYQVDNTAIGNQGGTGIGLALVKELVELQGGEIWVKSEVDIGTSFEVYLPVLEVDFDTNVLESTSEKTLQTIQHSTEEKDDIVPALSFNSSEKLDILIIEDNQEIREYIRYCIDSSKYNITEASNGEDGIQKAQALIPDLILSDVMMPQKSGFEVTQAIRTHINTSHIPIILLTAKASLESRLEGLQRGADAYLTKPFSPQELALRIDKLIELRQLLQQRYQNDLSSTAESPFQQEDEFITNLRNYILENLDKSNLNGDHIGRQFGMSRVHLFRKLKALTNQSITEFVRNLRLVKAKELLTEGKLNVSEIAYQTGFSSISHFSRTFKKFYGKAPSEM